MPQNCKGYMAPFQLYRWRRTSGTPQCIALLQARAGTRASIIYIMIKHYLYNDKRNNGGNTEVIIWEWVRFYSCSVFHATHLRSYQPVDCNYMLKESNNAYVCCYFICKYEILHRKTATGLLSHVTYKYKVTLFTKSYIM